MEHQHITSLVTGAFPRGRDFVPAADLPRHLQPQLVLLVPKLVSPTEHTTLAGVLLARLAEANREGVEQELELRLPVLSALGLLSIDPAAAEKVLHIALEVKSSHSAIYPTPCF
jgi:hypothetical protein